MHRAVRLADLGDHPGDVAQQFILISFAQTPCHDSEPG